jgi:membrane-associated protein
VLDSLVDTFSGSAWTYLLILAIVAGDAVLPAFPGETAVITGAIIAKDGHLSITLVVVGAFAGAMLGDVTSYAIGRTLGDRAIARLARGERAQERVAWSRDQLRRRGAWIIVVARFLPGGRTATTLASGSLLLPWRRFLGADAVGAGLWSIYIAALGWFGGEAFSDSLWKPLAVAFGVGIVLAGGAELLRRRTMRRRRV